MTYHEAIRRLFDADPRERGTAEITSELASRWPNERWKRSTVSTLLIALCVDHPSRHHYPTYARHAFLKRVGRGRYRPWETRDGPRERWIAATHADPLPNRGATQSRLIPTQTSDTKPEYRRPNWRVTNGRVEPPQPVDESSRRARHALVRELVESIHTEPFQPRYRRRPHGPTVVGWPARLLSYFWPTPAVDLVATNRAMDPWFERAGALARRLDDGSVWTDAQRDEATELARTMLRWGRVPPRVPLSPYVVEAVFQRALGRRLTPAPPMNSGWTKVAALATAYLESHSERYPHVIWDSRVSTSLVLRLDTLLRAHGHTGSSPLFPDVGLVPGRGGSRAERPVRSRLALSWPNGYGRWASQDAGSGLVCEIRNLLDAEAYPAMPLPDGSTGPWTIRGVESVLFMDGY